MTQTLTRHGFGMLVALLAAFSMATSALAYDELEIEIEFEDGKAYVDVSYEDEDDDDVDMDFVYTTDDEDEVYESLADELDLSVEAIKAAVSKIEVDDDDESDDDESDEDKQKYGERWKDKQDKRDDRPVLKQAVKCRADMLRDGERDRFFCRDGQWKEKRDARLKDITDGFVEAGDLSDDEAEEIRKEVEALIRQLIMLLMANRLGS
jgi:hypothetical protein